MTSFSCHSRCRRRGFAFSAPTCSTFLSDEDAGAEPQLLRPMALLAQLKVETRGDAERETERFDAEESRRISARLRTLVLSAAGRLPGFSPGDLCAGHVGLHENSRRTVALQFARAARRARAQTRKTRRKGSALAAA